MRPNLHVVEYRWKASDLFFINHRPFRFVRESLFRILSENLSWKLFKSKLVTFPISFVRKHLYSSVAQRDVKYLDALHQVISLFVFHALYKKQTKNLYYFLDFLRRTIARVPVLIGHGVGFKSSYWLSQLYVCSELSTCFKLIKSIAK